MSSPWTSPSIARTGAGGWLVVVVRARSRSTISPDGKAPSRWASRSIMVLNRKALAARPLKNRAGVCSHFDPNRGAPGLLGEHGKQWNDQQEKCECSSHDGCSESKLSKIGH